MNIYQKLNEVRKSVNYVQKDKEVGGKYFAVTHDAVTAALREHLIEHSVLIVPTVLKGTSVETKISTGKGIPYIRYEATYNVSFINCDAPEERVDVIIESHAMDEGDKAPGKAISYATKYAMLKLFSIETGEDEEGRPQMKPIRPPAKDEAEEVSRRIIDANVTPNAGVWEDLEPDMKIYLSDLAFEVKCMLANKDIKGAVEHIDEKGLENDYIHALFTRFDSKERSAMKAYKASIKETKDGLRAA